MRAWEKKRREADSTKDSWIFFLFFFLLVSHRLWAGRAYWSRVVVKKIVYNGWWLLRNWLTTVCWKAFDSFDSSNHVGQEKILIFLTGIQQPQESWVPFRSDGSHTCLSDTVKDLISFVRFQVCLCLERALWTHFMSPANKDDSSLL